MSDVVPGRPDPWQMRASDADREAYVAVLQTAYAEGRLSKDEYDERMAAAYQAATYADLAPLLHDLPAPATPLPGPPSLPVARPAGALPTSAGTAGSPLVALFSEVSRESRWTLAPDQTAVAVFGSVKLDLRQAQVTQSRSELRANALFGSVEITVPGDVHVEVNGFGAFGEYKRIDRRSDPRDDPAAPVVVVSGLALFGSVQVEVVDPPVAPGERVLPPGDR